MLESKMHMSRVKGVGSSKGFGQKKAGGNTAKAPQLVEYVKNRDYTGAIALLEFQRNSGEGDGDTLLWLGYCAFHLGEFRKALEAYTTYQVRFLPKLLLVLLLRPSLSST